MNELFSSVVISLLGLTILMSCGGNNEPIEDSEPNSGMTNNGATKDISHVEIINASATIVDEHYDCSSGLMVRYDCYSYGMTFVVKNNSPNLSVDRLNSVKIEIGRDLIIESPVSCKEHPWTVPPAEQTSVMEIQYIANAGGFSEQIQVRLPCGSIDRLETYRVEPEPFSAGVSNGNITLTLSGIMEDASPWKIVEEIAF